MKKYICSIIIFIFVFTFSYFYDDIVSFVKESIASNLTVSYNLEEIPEYTGQDYVVINNNEPLFEEYDKSKNTFEEYGDLDILGRCTYAFANIGKEIMPTSKRGSIGSVKPSGWHLVKYDNVDGKYLYNRCHLIAYQLSGENANKKNLITCTRQMNTKGMLKWENIVKEYIDKTNNHVLYRVKPIYYDTNLLASGVTIEALSIEDNGKGIKFYVYVYNVQDGINIDYKNGNSYKEK